MQVMYILYPFNGLQRNPYLRQGTTARRTLEQDVQRLPHNRQRTPQNQRGDQRESTGSIQLCPVNRIATPPTITAAVESVSPSM